MFGARELEAQPRLIRLRDDRVYAVNELIKPLVVKREKQLLLRSKVMVDRSGQQSDHSGDITQRSLCIASLSETYRGCFENLQSTIYGPAIHIERATPACDAASAVATLQYGTLTRGQRIGPVTVALKRLY